MTADTPSAPSVVALLRDRRWSAVAVGSMVSLIGFWNYAIVGALVVQEQTGRVLLVGVFTSLQFGANLLLSPFAAVLFERTGTRTAMTASAVASAVVGGGLALAASLDALTVPWVFGGAAVAGVASAVTTPGLQVLMQEVLDQHEVPTAVVVQSAAMTMARAIGPALAGIWLFLGSAAAAFVTHGLGYAAFAVAIACARPRPAAMGTFRSGDSLLGRLRALGSSRSDRSTLVGLLALTLAIAWGVDPVNTLLPALADRYGYGDRGVGVLASAFGLGAVVATAAHNRLARRWSPPGLASTGLVLLGVGLLAGAVAGALGPAAAAFAVGGVGFVLAFTSVTAALQALQRRFGVRDVMGLWSAAFIGGRLPASLANGGVADLLGVVPATALVGAALVLVGVSVPPRVWSR